MAARLQPASNTLVERRLVECIRQTIQHNNVCTDVVGVNEHIPRHQNSDSVQQKYHIDRVVSARSNISELITTGMRSNTVQIFLDSRLTAALEKEINRNQIVARKRPAAAFQFI